MAQSRNTVQKHKIKEFLYSTKNHPTAETVFKAVKKDIPTITLATVYRNLHKMADNGEILRFEINGEYHFDADKNIHRHAVCSKCGKIMDLPCTETCKQLIEKFDSKNFTPETVKIIFEGKCKNCN
ncbi:MAG: transcriptional repressor [Candidatus Diapherotrites archaeon]